jgi:cell division protein FtsN
MVVGLLIGLALALGVALYITKTPVPFIDKVPQRTPEQDSAETEHNRHWDPNAALAPRLAASGVVAGEQAASGAAAMAVPVAARPGALPAPPAVTPPSAVPPPVPGAAPSTTAVALPHGMARGAVSAPEAASSATSAASAADAVDFFVQAGAFTRNEDAEQQRARLGLLGQTAKISQRDQAGRSVYRVRLGPLATREEAVDLQAHLQSAGVETQIVRVPRS